MILLSVNKKLLKDYSTGETVNEFLAIRKASVGQAKNGKNYLDLKLHDGQIEVTAKQWDFIDSPPKENTVIKVQATMDSYQGQPQLIIQKWRQAEPGESDPAKFIPKCPQDLNDLMGAIDEAIIGIYNDGLRKLVDLIISDYKEAFMMAPAALNHHHNYLGGLLEHTVGVLDKSLQIADNKVNIDLLVAGAILHDIGKIQEYDWSGCTIQMDSDGRLLGHIPMGLMMISKYMRKVPELNDESGKLLLHLIASHHGKMEWGSPVEPMIKEAVILHNADVLDAQMWKINHAQADVEQGNWTNRIYGINKEFYVPITSEVLK